MNQESLITGGELVADFLVSSGVDMVFCITGAGNLAIVDALELRPEIQVIYSHHEQAAVMEAQGYARVAGKPGVVLVTTGGGTSNALTGVLGAQMDSVPILIISGNESSFHCERMRDFRAFGVQGFDSTSVFSPVTKASIRIIDVQSIIENLDFAWSLLSSDRPGVCHLDIPMDLQRRLAPSRSARGSMEKVRKDEFPKTKFEHLLKDLLHSKRPIFYFGNGIRGNKTRKMLETLWSVTGLPMYLSWSAIDFLEEGFPGNLGRIGIYGDRSANITLQKADLVIAIGTRLAIPQVGYDRTDFGRRAKKWVIDLDPVELTKFESPGWNTIRARGEDVTLGLIDRLSVSDLPRDSWATWFENANEMKLELPRRQQVGPSVSDESRYVHSIDVITALNDALSEDAVIVTDVGAALLSGHYGLELKGNQRLFTSQGLGEMGFGLPGAIGAWFGDRTRQLICLNTDGAIMMNLQELQLVAGHKIPMKLFIFNNEGYGMIKISQENLFDGRLNGVDTSSGVSFPDFRLVANAFGFEYGRISSISDLKTKLADYLSSPKAQFIEIAMDPNQKYLPRLATAKLEDGSFVSPPLEDLDPKIALTKLEALLGYRAHPQSYAARGIPYET